MGCLSLTEMGNHGGLPEGLKKGVRAAITLAAILLHCGACFKVIPKPL